MLSRCSFLLQQICIFLPHAFFCLKMLFLHLFIFPHRLCVFSTSSYFSLHRNLSKEDLDSLRFTFVSILSIFWIFSLAKSWRSSVLFFTVPRIARSLNFCEVWKNLTATARHLFFQFLCKCSKNLKSLNFCEVCMIIAKI